jgi:peptide/nickel transport system substrate-binding protein
MRKQRLFAVLTSGACLTLMLSLGPTATANASANIRHGGVLHVVMPWVTIPDNFNPLNPGQTGSTAGGTESLVYEGLAYDNPYTGVITDLLSTGWTWSNGGKTLTMDTRTGVDWSDGKPFSAADVAFTFNYIHKYPALDINGLWAAGLESASVGKAPNTVVLTFKTASIVQVPEILKQMIIPKHIWSKIADPVTYPNLHPVGTGAFLLKSFSPTLVSYVKNPNYWQAGEPYVSGVTYEAVKSDDTAELLVLNGDAAYTYDYITDAPATFESAHPWNKIFWPAYEDNILYMNDAAAPFNDVNFRKAVAMTVNTTQVANLAYFGALPAANESAVTSGQVSSWVPSSVSSLQWSYNPSAALSMLESNGYKLAGGQLEDPAGNTIPTLKILIGAGWTDFISVATTIQSDLKQIGISSTVDQEPWSTYYPSILDGTYQFAVSWSNNNNATPYYEYYSLLDSAEMVPDGTASTGDNWERWSSPTVDSALASYASTSSLSVQKTDMATVEKSVLQNVPVIPLTGRANWTDYSTRYFTGWPSAKNAYNAGEPPDSATGAELMFLNVHLG